jgi:hypothetical protein
MIVPVMVPPIRNGICRLNIDFRIISMLTVLFSRYLAGKDVEQWLGAKRNMSDEDFYKMMKQNLIT